ncbi:MAG: ABC transporter permease [Lachnospiraceae bacterium]|nr:ABC transporter permease [Lachnospiraceae bacterium]
MLHLIKYCLLTILRQKETVFWSMLFPVLLGALFYASFGSSNTEIETIDIAVVETDNSEMSKNFINFLEMIEEDESELIAIQKLSKEEANKKLEDLKITGLFYACEEPELVVTSNNISSSILKSLLDTFIRQAQMYKDIMAEKPQKLQEAANSAYLEFASETTLTGKKVDGMVQYFYSLIGMACMFGCFIGYLVSVQLQANVSAVGLRRAISATSKFKQFIAGMITSVFVHYINLAILLLYLQYVLKIDLSGNIFKLIGICITGGFIGVGIGMFVGTLSRLSDGLRIGILVAGGLLLSFLSGLMVGGMKGLIEENVPLLNRINPASVITDAIYSITIYDDPGRYTLNIVTLVIMSLVIGAVTFIITRRECYDSI